jgi:very-short-patch-repair endonuclease
VPGARFTESVDAVIAAGRTEVRGLPVTSVARTIVDLAGRRGVTAPRLDAIIVAAHRERQASVDEVAAFTETVRRRGRRGIGKLDLVFAARTPGAPVPASELEERLAEVVARAGLAAVAVAQHPLPGGGRPGFVDVAFPTARLVVEADGRRWHSQEQDMERDRERDNRAAAAGWLSMRFMYRQLVGDAAAAAAQIRDTYERRRTGAADRQPHSA